MIESQAELEDLIEFERRSRWSKRSQVSAETAELLGSLLGKGAHCEIERVVAQAQRFDSPLVTESNLVIEPRSVSISSQSQTALHRSIERVRSFHESQRKALFGQLTAIAGGYEWSEFDADDAESREGQIARPIRRVGIYVPGGGASYPSSVIMNAVPALVAGVQEIVMASPAQKNGELMPEVEWVAKELGIRQIIKVGGAAAIAALAYGIDGHLEPVDLIVGPGNRFVNEAKRLVWGVVGVDMQAGPSEVGVVVDESTRMDFAVADLLTQVEHAPDNIGRVYSVGTEAAKKFEIELEDQLARLARREIAEPSLKQSAMVIFGSRMAATDIGRAIDAFAPEHLTIQTKEPDSLSQQVRNAGSIALGPYMAQSFGDYVTGPSHTLPTGGAARFSSPNSILTFIKFSSMSRASGRLAMQLAPWAVAMSVIEGFGGHRRGAELRLDQE